MMTLNQLNENRLCCYHFLSSCRKRGITRGISTTDYTNTSALACLTIQIYLHYGRYWLLPVMLQHLWLLLSAKNCYEIISSKTTGCNKLPRGTKVVMFSRVFNNQAVKTGPMCLAGKTIIKMQQLFPHIPWSCFFQCVLKLPRNSTQCESDPLIYWCKNLHEDCYQLLNG